MRKLALGALITGLALLAGQAWAMAGADIGGVWVQASWNAKLALTSIISRELGGEPNMYLNCLERMFQDPANLNKTIIEAAKECKAKNPQ
jgi:hypothetical protein